MGFSVDEILQAEHELQAADQVRTLLSSGFRCPKASKIIKAITRIILIIR
jgi:hypothetical protein